ncbi:hypothetical protein [Cellulophaga sp. HaHa_2_1]|uniref:hypothetical protein n=1 Tax=Cellulophaga sp. HaHa_2_1 TaxID=2749994 RepID=UPI001C4EE275|nr:hypothetical protein [Cellulophaga sp. HaHa_2_1]QXP53225.1 hypothetical protein H0I24_04630 [Cellulophaga sp. HaHa_2_1]
MAKLNASLKRDITHISYPSNRKRNDYWAGYMPFKITEKPIDYKDKYVGEKEDIIFLNNSYIVSKDPQHIFPLIFGGITLFIALYFLSILYFSDIWSISNTIILIICTSSVIFFTIYYFTMPLKQVIFDRYNGLITFPGFLWNRPITMKFESIRMLHAGGALGSPTADMLYVKRPDRIIGSKYMLHVGGNLDTNLSFIVWYMDKNRPLPDGDAFDDYRKKEYKRRKEEGFPPPLFRTFIPTDEFKLKWQIERDKHWKDIISTNKNGDVTHQLWQSPENIALHGEWKEVVPR